MKPFHTPKGSEPAGTATYQPYRNLHDNRHTDGAPTKVTDLYGGRGEKIDGGDHSTSGRGKM